MKIQDILDAYYESSSKVSDISRQLSFAGIGIIWILRIGNDSGDITFSQELTPVLFMFVLALMLDLGQYIYKTVIWFALNSYYWNKHRNNNAEVEPSFWVNVPTNLLFISKVVLVVYSFSHLLLYLQGQI